MELKKYYILLYSSHDTYLWQHMQGSEGTPTHFNLALFVWHHVML